MAEIVARIFVALLVVQGVGTLVYVFFTSRMLSSLEAHERSAHEALGSPSLFLNNTPRNNWLVIGWLWRKEFLSLAHPEVVRRAGLVRALLLALAVNFATLLLLFFAFGAVLHSV
jgi:hypothetical protein